MAKNNRTCHVCGNSYRFCPSCAEFADWEYWHVMFHDQNCHDIWYTLGDFEDGKITKEEAIEKMKKLDTSKIVNKHVIESYNKLFDIKPEIEEEKVEVVSKPDAVEAAVQAIEKAFDIVPDNSSTDAEDEAKAEEKKSEEFKKPQQKYHNKKK